ncbi:class I SAM-dependent methyltransferase [Paenibacillus sp. 481]|uniref:class I SAM-dependent methyltransferase n=1 Tax=Paenibacillus sp. 481 TaxID=2835869 RepID=UPI001E565542|nr:SAM-dependent methyltransferase [Paenibacillus sp. 481]UHA74140.1 SAM-dependent methyltransferase [Paenibacillus sp. 481]
MSHYQLNRPLVQHLIYQMNESPLGALSFSTYMDACLYHPTHGYYMSDRSKVGRDGDFYTSAYIGSIMADMIGNYVQRTLQARGWSATNLTVVEWGAGTGRLAVQLNERLQQLQIPIGQYAIVETSPYHRAQAEAALCQRGFAAAFWDERNYLQFVAHNPVIVIANELLDAFPVERIRFRNRQLEQCYVVWNEDCAQFQAMWRPASAPLLRWVEEQQLSLADNLIYEASVVMSNWLQQMVAASTQAEFVFIDYGDTTEHLTASYRMEGTLMCYYRHQAHDDPFSYIGEQDITSMVDFDISQRAARLAGAATVNLMTQKQFLLEQGILQELQAHTEKDPFSDKARRNRSIRQLLLSDQMSERFHVLTVSK